MKKYFYILIIILASFSLNSCLEEYLDRAPDSGLTEKTVFTRYENYKKYFDAVYGEGSLNLKNAYNLYFNFWGFYYTWDGFTDMSGSGNTIKSGLMGEPTSFTSNTGARPILGSMFRVIRISNQSIYKIGMLKDATQEAKDDILAQAYFVRAYAHFILFRIWGGMPYLTKELKADDDWDQPRLSKHETLMKIVADLDTATSYFQKAGTMRRDPLPGNPGSLNSPDQFRPNGTAAIALKGRVLLFAASPLNNELGDEDWKAAAKANGEALKVAEQYGYTLLSAADYKTNCVGAPYTNEQLWAWSAGNKAYNSTDLNAYMPPKFVNKSTVAETPTQNAVDKFETIYGDPLNTNADRQKAISLGHFKEQDPYANRDPRLANNIIYNQSPAVGWQNGKAQIWYQTVNGVDQYSELMDFNLGRTITGYWVRKYWGDQSTKNPISPAYSDPLIRLAEVYLNYAEATNEAYGPNTAAPGSDLTAVQAINIIRNRIGMPNVLSEFTTDKEKLRERIKNERNVELMFEGHYFFDIRRWKDAPVSMSGPLYGMDIKKVTVSSGYPTGFQYTRVLLPVKNQSAWKDAMYYFPFEQKDMFKMKNFTFNEQW